MSLPKTYKTEAIVIKHADLGEADRILTLITSRAGKIRAVGKGVRRMKSRLGGHLEPLTHCSLMLTRGRQLDTISQSQTIDAFFGIRGDLRLTAYALYLSELTDAFSSERAENYPIYKLLLDTLHHLEKTPSVTVLSRYFELQLVGHAGYQPQLHECLNCHTPLKPVANYFTPSGGGVLCPDCMHIEAVVQPLSLNSLKVLRLLQSSDWASVGRLRLKTELSQELERITRGYARYLLERDLKSTAFIHRLKREGIAEEVD